MPFVITNKPLIQRQAQQVLESRSGQAHVPIEDQMVKLAMLFLANSPEFWQIIEQLAAGDFAEFEKP